MRLAVRLLLPGIAMLAAAGVLLLIVGGWNSDRQPELINEIPIPEPHWGEGAREAPEHIRRVRRQLEHVKGAAPAAEELASAYGELGKTYLAYNIPASAVACFQNAAQLDLDEFRWPYFQALAHQDLLDTQSSADAMTEALQRQRREPATPLEHRVATLCFLGEADLRLNKLEDARSCFNEALRLAPNSVFALFKRGQLAAQTNDPQGAIQDFQQALSLVPGGRSRPLALALALEMQKLGRAQEAARYRTLAAAGSDDASIRFSDPLRAEVHALNRRPSAIAGRVQTAMARGDLQTALTQLEEGLETSPESGDLLVLRAQVLLRRDRVQDAIRDLEAVKQSDPGNEQARILLIETLAGSSETSQRALQEAVAWRNGQPQALRPQIVLAALQFQEGQVEDAHESYLTAGRRFPRESSPRLGAAVALCALGRYAEALAGFTAAVDSFPDDAYLKHQFARFLVTCPDESVRNPGRGLELVRELLSEDDTVPLNETLVCALAACGRIDEARRRLADLAGRDDTQGQPSLQARFQAIADCIDDGRPVTEPWPFEFRGDGRPATP